jgi:putative intracellular protease/amidase
VQHTRSVRAGQPEGGGGSILPRRNTALRFEGHRMSKIHPDSAPSCRVMVALVFPGVTALDLVGPQAVLGALPGMTCRLVARKRRPIVTDTGLRLLPDDDFATAPERPDILLVPGGAEGVVTALGCAATLDWLARAGAEAGWVTAVCSGALLLGAAGLLRGYRATSHWAVRDELTRFGARPVARRVVIDGNRATGGGVTAGIDFGLALAARLAGEEEARAIQLGLEYAPEPPFDAGAPDRAGPALVERVLAGWDMAAAAAALDAAEARLGPACPLLRPGFDLDLHREGVA